ncbi:hypothetical protein HNY73_004754 [Argiope bruennichi]|uniref:Uncharacterized protein n=1 Tax=Argiope bruennichi TaxID=94029 RepID=A0A8T0FPX5_ARGBR|nr:hypothetical protein HNY73_004754 [Argiope bruennichi]
MDPESLDIYYKCYNYATCQTTGPDHQRQHNCIFQNATLQDLTDLYEFIQNNGYFHYKSKTQPEAVKEYCNYHQHHQRKAFDQTLKGIMDGTNSICGMSNKQDECNRLHKALNCFFPILKDLHAKGKC